MRYRTLAGLAVLLTIGGCREVTAPHPDSVAGQFVWLSLDGSEPVCCASDSAGVVSTVRSGELDIGWNTPAGAYRMGISRMYIYANGDTTWGSTLYASGMYTWDGHALTLDGGPLTPADSGSSGSVTGAFSGGLLVVHSPHHAYRFMRLIEMPH